MCPSETINISVPFKASALNASSFDVHLHSVVYRLLLSLLKAM